VEVLYYLVPTDFRKNVAWWKVPRLRPFVLVRATGRRRNEMEHWWSDFDNGKPKYSEKYPPPRDSQSEVSETEVLWDAGYKIIFKGVT